MSDASAFPDFSSTLRLDTLVRLRWLAVVGQGAAVLIVYFVLGFPLPLLPCIALIGLSAFLNLVLRILHPASLRLRSAPASFMLAYDVLQLGGLLYLTGGLDNPFSILLLVPMVVSATTLAPRPTMLLGILVVAVASVLGFLHLPLPWRPEGLDLPILYTGGVWFALVAACIFTGIYTFRVAEESRQLAKALNATEMVLAREQHLSALDGLAAAAAHELGTPLATIALVAKELEREIPAGSPHAEDIALLRSQAQRCRDILAKLTSLSAEVDPHLARQPLSHLVDEVTAPYRGFAARIVVAPGPPEEGAEPVGRRNPAVVEGLANLVENAVDFATAEVTVTPWWNAREVSVTIADDGPGYAATVIDRLGEPYVTTRSRTAGETDQDAGGLGLGLFIAKTLLERTGARLAFFNRTAPGRGAVVRVAWPRRAMDQALAEADGEAESLGGGITWRAEVKSL